MLKRFLFVLYFAVLFSHILFAQEPEGTIIGRVLDRNTKQPLSGVNILLENSNLGTATDLDGYYRITNVLVGTYSVSFQYIGYESQNQTDIIVNSGRIFICNIELDQSILEGENIEVISYFSKSNSEPISVISFNKEEIRRSPGSAGDVSRILMALPSTAQVADNANDLMVRGGSPSENAFYVDNIQIPNINHFPVQGASGGPIGLLNVDFIDDIKFYTGGFSSIYGDRLSSVIDMNFREGNRETFEAQLDVSFSGFGGIVEGPLPGNKGSWFLSARRSYLDFIVGAIGTGVAPRYGDVHIKSDFDLNQNNKLSFLNIFGNSSIKYSRKESEDIGNPNFGDYNTYQNTVGLNWLSVWDNNGYSETSLSYSFINSKDNWYDVKTGAEDFGSDYLEGNIRLRNVNHWQINKQNKMDFGLEITRNLANYDYYFSQYFNRVGNIVNGLKVKDSFNSTDYAGFINYSYNPLSNLAFNFGLRSDYFSFSKKFYTTPRISSSFKLTSRLTMNAAYGLFYQSLPTFLLSQDENNKDLENPEATHYVLGFDYMLTDDTKLTFEAYDKEYKNFPIDPNDPSLFVIDEGRSNSFFRRYENLQSKGKAFSRGVEILLQKKLAKDFYGLVSGSIFKSRYKAIDGVWRDRIYDNQYLFSFIGGYKPNNRWEFSARWTYAGGVPYTPFDQEESRIANAGIIDQSKINKSRYPNYHALNLRMDKRFFFSSSNIVIFVSIWNAYNRQNIASYYWDEVDNKQDQIDQWSLLPIVGFEYEL